MSIHLYTQNFWKSVKPYWDISFQCSRSYRWVMSIVTTLYFLSVMVMMQSMFRSESNQMLPALLFRACVEAGIFFISCHFFIRPYLKLYLLPQNRFGWNVLQFLCFAFCLALVMIVLIIQLAKLSPFGNLDFSNINIQHPDDAKNNMTMKLTLFTLVFIGAINLTLMYSIWALAYLFWHTLVSKKQIQRQMREAQMQQLTNQLNPHFLFNALNSIRALIFEDQQKAAHTLTQLSELFRVHLQSHLNPVSALEDEWQIAQRYLEIEQVRLEQRLQLELKFDESLWQQQLPTLTLLTLVENAIKHGINPSQISGTLEIISRRLDKKHWQICVNNTLDGDAMVPGTQTGLANLQQRLHLLSPLHTLSYRKTPQHFEVTINMYQAESAMELTDD
ncbi:sensor histidine kinase [Cellvibrio sp. NN19]|uniref:sensor histidine kinase n=1 Tax=Cellvibrio chitinivorans TaxID=3102792 RepID=UPI002B40742B|nr:histidine kinase [Cellvibrio sp. NN19]